MSVWDETPSSLTTFTPLSSDVQASGSFLKRWFRRGKDDSDKDSDSAPGSKSSSREVSVDREQAQTHTPSDLSLGQLTDTSSSAVNAATQNVPTTQEADTEATRPVQKGPADKMEMVVAPRRLNSVITRLSAILEHRTSTPQGFRDSDFKQYWMPDSSCKECYDCGDKFTTFRRRHHCRICGQIFCHVCCSHELPGKIIGYKGSIRVCTYCSQVVQRYALKSDPSADPRVTTELLHKAYLESDGVTSPEQGVKGQRRSTLDLQPGSRSPGGSEQAQPDGTAPFDLTPQSEFLNLGSFMSERRLLVQDSVQLRDLWSLMMDPDHGVEFQSYRVILRTYQRCILGNKLVDWLLKQDKASSRIQAVAIGQALIDADYLDPLLNITAPFRDDFTLYRPSELAPTDLVTPAQDRLNLSLSQDSAPLWFREIQSSTDHDRSSDTMRPLDTNEGEASASGEHTDRQPERIAQATHIEHADEPLPQQNSLVSYELTDPMFSNVVPEPEKSSSDLGYSYSGTWKTLDIASEDSIEKVAFDLLQHEHHDHLTQLTKQLVSDDHLPQGWADIVISTVDRVSLFVKPDVKNSGDDIDIRHYVHIKKIPGGKREQTGLVHGVVFNKNIAHKKMSHHISNPRTLLLYGSIEYQRVENKLSFFQPQILQEEEFLRNSISKIASLKPKPDVLVVEKSVSRLAQDFLLKSGITLVYNTKLSVMERLSRFLQADIVESIDSLVRGPNLGFCHSFAVRNFSLPTLPSGEAQTKTMLCFDGCATHLGCAVTLRGGSTAELKKVKKIMNFMIYASYHSRLEIAFCMDEFLMPPNSTNDFDLDTNETSGDEIGAKVGAIMSSNVGALKGDSAIDAGKVSFYVGEDSVVSELAGKDNTHVVNRVSPVSKKEGEPKENKVTIDNSDLNRNILDESVSEISMVTGVCKDKANIISASEQGSLASMETTSTNNGTEVPAPVNNDVQSDMDSNTAADQSKPSSLNVIETGQLVDNTLSTDQSETQQLDQTGSVTIPVIITNTMISADRNPCTTNESAITKHQGNTQNKYKGKKLNVPNLKHVQSESALKTDKIPSPSRKSISTPLTDHSDPLHNYQHCQDDSIFESDLRLEEHRHAHRFKLRAALESVILTTSPYILYDLPYLETEHGSKCELRKYFADDIYWSNHFSASKTSRLRARQRYSDIEPAMKPELPSNIHISKAHELIWCQLNMPITDKTVQRLVAKYRAYGGRINILGPHNGFLAPTKVNQAPQQGKGKENQSGKGRRSSLTPENHGKDVGVQWERKIDCLDPSRHQRIAVLFSSFSYASENHPSPCVYPWVVTMEFYGRNDITLGGFLERFCFRPSYVCPSDSCSTPMVDHIRRFAHGQTSISIVLKRLDHPIQNGQTTILIWSWCYKCKQVTPVIPMSTDTWHMSFAKYLEVRFHGKQFQRRVTALPCQHSLHHDHFQYFGFKDTVASFKFSPIKLKEIKLPPFVISQTDMVETIYLYRLRDEAKRLAIKATDLYSCILDCMSKMKAESDDEGFSLTVNNFVAVQQVEKTKLRELAHGIREMLASLLKHEDNKIHHLTPEERLVYGEVEDDLVQLKRAIADSVTNWNSKLQDLYIKQRKLKQGASQKRDKDAASLAGSAPVTIMDKDARNSKDVSSSLTKSVDPDTSGTDTENRERDDTLSMLDSEFDPRRLSESNSLTPATPIRAVNSTSSIDSFVYGVTPGIFAAAGVWPAGSVPDSQSDSYVVCHRGQVPEPIPIDFDTSAEDLGSLDDLVSEGIMASHDDGADNLEPKEVELKPVLEPGDDDSTTESGDHGTLSVATEDAAVSLSSSTENKDNSMETAGNKDVFSSPKVDIKQEVATAEHDGKGSNLAAPPGGEKVSGDKHGHPDKESKKSEEVEGSAGDKMTSIRKTLMSTIWQGSGAYQLQMPFDASEHHQLAPCDRVPVIVYDHEPSSIIAYSLSCRDYHMKLYEIQSSYSSLKESQGHSANLRSSKTDTDLVNKDKEEEFGKSTKSGKLSFFRGSSKETTSPRPEMLDSVKYVPRTDLESPQALEDIDRFNIFSTSTSESSDKNKTGKQASTPHIELQFSDSTARFYCKVYFAEQFRQLRKHLFPAGEDAFIRSISRCKPWEAKGGKSGLEFCKTDDDRFILKQMSGMEEMAFESFGPQYFQYIMRSEAHQRPTVLAKIVGVYRIGFRNQQTNHAMKQDLLVVENLFYNRNISQTFDLKGSERNRLVKTTRKHDEELVLLDENLLRVSVDCPLYILPHSKTVLTLAISNDSQFLSSNLVMDYSLLVGLDEEKKELVVGIIDYIRTFTWDKKLETMVKSKIPGSGKMPTVVSPEVYRTRFLDAMSKYFLPVPDQWSGLGRDVDS